LNLNPDIMGLETDDDAEIQCVMGGLHRSQRRNGGNAALLVKQKVGESEYGQKTMVRWISGGFIQ
jgi:hypothetical protein